MVAPPSEARAWVFITFFLTVPPLPSGTSSNSLKLASRVLFVSWAMRSMAQSSGLSSQWSEPGARYFTLVQRWSLTVIWIEATPLGHSVPWLMGESGSPSRLTSCPESSLMRIIPHPTEQSGQRLEVSRPVLIGTASAAPLASFRSRPRPRASAATAVPTVPSETLMNWRRVSSMAGWTSFPSRPGRSVIGSPSHEGHVWILPRLSPLSRRPRRRAPRARAPARSQALQRDEKDGREVEGHQLGKKKPSHHREAQRPARVRPRPDADGDGQGSRHRRHRRHHDGAEADDRPLEDRLLGG